MEFLKVLVALTLFVVYGEGERGAYRSLVVPQTVLSLPELPFSQDALEPLLDAATLKVHHGGHHKAYCDKTNAALEEWRTQDNAAGLSSASIVEVLQHLDEVPEEWRERLRNNAGGFVNHVFYWETMCPSNESQEPVGKLAQNIAATYGSFEGFRSEFSDAAAKLFGSGYVWLCEDSTGKLIIVSTHNQDSPLTSGLYPLLVLDVWEHAYYLKHQNKRSKYISSWWEVVCWQYVEEIRKFWYDHRSKSLNNNENATTSKSQTHQDL